MWKLLNFSDYLRGWIGAVGLISMINAGQAVWNPELLVRNVYTGSPKSVTSLASRQFAMWTGMCGLVRLVFCVNPDDACTRALTVSTFLLTVAHYLAEVYVWGTSKWTFGVISPCFIAGISLCLFLLESVTRPARQAAAAAVKESDKTRLERMMAMKTGAGARVAAAAEGRKMR